MTCRSRSRTGVHATAPVLSYCHGYPSSTHDVAEVFGRLDDWRLVAIDFIGFGASGQADSAPG